MPNSMWNEHDGFHEVQEWTNLNRKKSSQIITVIENYRNQEKMRVCIKSCTVFQEMWYKLLNRITYKVSEI